MPLSEIIIKEIQKNGPLSFRDFMEMALYYPELGYYTSSKNKIGKKGDFYTSPNLSATFGEKNKKNSLKIPSNGAIPYRNFQDLKDAFSQMNLWTLFQCIRS